MELTDLTPQERLALVALVIEMVEADGPSSSEEMEEFRELAMEVGRREFDESFREAKMRFNNRGEILEYLKTVERQEAREMIHTCVVDLAATDGIAEVEEKILSEMRGLWGIRTARNAVGDAGS